MNKIARKIGVAVIALATIVSVSGIAPAVAETPAELLNVAVAEIGGMRAQVNALLTQVAALINQISTLQARIDRIAATPFPMPTPPTIPTPPTRPITAPATIPTPPTPPTIIAPPPFIVDLRSSLANISQGESITLSWSTTGATNCRIITREAATRRVLETRHVNLNGEIRVSPLLTAIYTLTCNRRDNMIEIASSEEIITLRAAAPAPRLTPILPTPPVSLIPTQCRVVGCSGEICSDQDIITTCEFRPEFACFRAARCERQVGNQCGWTMTPELQACLTQHRSPQATY